MDWICTGASKTRVAAGPTCDRHTEQVPHSPPARWPLLPGNSDSTRHRGICPNAIGGVANPAVECHSEQAGQARPRRRPCRLPPHTWSNSACDRHSHPRTAVPGSSHPRCRKTWNVSRVPVLESTTRSGCRRRWTETCRSRGGSTSASSSTRHTLITRHTAWHPRSCQAPPHPIGRAGTAGGSAGSRARPPDGLPHPPVNPRDKDRDRGQGQGHGSTALHHHRTEPSHQQPLQQPVSLTTS